MSLNLPYYYGHAGEQYAFFRIPKLLLTDDRFAEISTDAKLLYGLLLDRMELSYRNGWIDEQNKKTNAPSSSRRRGFYGVLQQKDIFPTNR